MDLKTYKSNTDPVKEGCRDIQEVEGLLMPREFWAFPIYRTSSVVSYALSSSGTCGLLPSTCVCVRQKMEAQGVGSTYSGWLAAHS